MPTPLFHFIASWFLKKRIHQMEHFIKFPIEVQEQVLQNLLYCTTQTEIGRRYEFSSIRTYETFKNRVPIVTYEEIAGDIERCRKGTQNIFWSTPIKWFAKSSGTTNAKSKFIPVSNEALEECHYKAGKDMLSLYFNNNENSQLFTGKCLRLAGSKELYNKNEKVYFGDLSAIVTENLPIWAEFSSTPSTKVSLMTEWESKLSAIIKESLQDDVTGLLGVPSWMMVLLQRVMVAMNKDNLFEVWPNLEVYFHGGVNFNPYRGQYEQILPSPDFKYYEIYNASEGFFAIQDQNDSSELLLMLDYGIFYEFIPMEKYGNHSEDDVIPLQGVQIGIQYALIITTNGGLWRYNIGDTIEFISLSPYRVRVTGRTKHHINVFGEELIIDNAEKALSIAAKKTGAHFVDYTVGPIFMNGDKKGAHEWIIEFKVLPTDLGEFIKILDYQLKCENSDYEAKRYKDLTLNPPKVHQAREKLFYDWFAKNKKLGGQNKVPRLSNKRNFIEELLDMN